MPKAIVINTSSILALISALGDLKVLSYLYEEVLVPFYLSQNLIDCAIQQAEE